MKKLLLGLVLCGLLVSSMASAVPVVRIMDPIKWVKAPTTTTAFDYDSTRVMIPFSVMIRAAELITYSDTTQAVDLANLKLMRNVPSCSQTAADSCWYIWAYIKSYTLAGVASATTDSAAVAVDLSVDGSNWTVVNGATGCWQTVGVGNCIVAGIGRLNRNGSGTGMTGVNSTLDLGAFRFVRWRVANIGPYATALPRLFEVRPAFWTDQE